VTDSRRYAWPNEARAAAVITFDLDAESGVLGDFPGAASRLGIMSHQIYGPRTGLPRLLRILDRRQIRATFFVPGFTAERHPHAVRGILDAGHEIAHHGYLHERVDGASEREEEGFLLRGIEALERVTGVRPVGWRAPMWEVNYRTPALLARNGLSYDSSLMDADRPYLLAAGEGDDDATIVEVPVHWSLDDGEQYAWLPGIWEGATIENPRKVLDMWTQEFDAMADEGECFVLTNHPFLSGRPSRARTLDRLLEHIQESPGVWITTAGDLAAFVAGLQLPAVRHVPPLPSGQSPGRRTVGQSQGGDA
jgi:peptidoglycan-N-acetylglucosamine deacetylase